jgi:hypothetical protein
MNAGNPVLESNQLKQDSEQMLLWGGGGGAVLVFKVTAQATQKADTPSAKYAVYVRIGITTRAVI